MGGAEKVSPLSLGQAGCGHRADFGECPPLGDKLPFLPGTNSPLETLSSLFHIYFSDRLPRAKSCHAGSAVAAVVQIRKPATQRKVLTRIHVFCDLVASSLREASGSRCARLPR